MMERRRILFVDGPHGLEELKTAIALLGDRWDSRFAANGREGLKQLEKERFTALVSDIHMAVTDDRDLLHEVKERYPDVVRIVLSDPSEREVVLKSAAKTAHQYLTKPCDPAVLRSALESACDLRGWLGNDTIKRVVSRMDSIPSIPSLYNEIMYELSRPDVSVPKIAAIISKDVGMAAKVLQVVNSAFFALRQRVTNIAQAVNLLGYDIVKGLVLSLHVFSQFALSRGSGLNLGDVWKHSFRVGLYSKAIAEAETGDRGVIDDAFMAGMLHDVGKLVLATNFPDECNAVRRLCEDDGIHLIEAERRVLGATHYETGGYFSCLWGLPDAIVRAVSFHHLPCCLLGEGVTSLMAVYAANIIDHHTERREEENVLVLTEGAKQDDDGVSAVAAPLSVFEDVDFLWGGGRISAWISLCRAIASKEGEDRA